MATKVSMRDAPPPGSERSGEVLPARRTPRTWLEIVIAALGFAAWLWCALVVMRH